VDRNSFDAFKLAGSDEARNLGAHLSGFRGALAAAGRIIAQDVEHGALPTLYAATQDIPGNSFVGPNGFGHLRGYPEVLQPSRASQDPGLARHLWGRSAELTEVDSRDPTPV
jgi:hypothetical protein